jgi:hypothetical protein
VIAAQAIVSRLKEKGISRRGWRRNEIATKIAMTAENPDPKRYTPTPGTLDPRPVANDAQIDLGGGVLGSDDRNCIFGAAIYDLEAAGTTSLPRTTGGGLHVLDTGSTPLDP